MTATMTWNANTEPDLVGYLVYHGNAPGVYYETFTVLAPTTTKVLTGLYDWLPHYFSVTAYDNAVPPNESAHSSEVLKQIYLRKILTIQSGASCG